MFRRFLEGIACSNIFFPGGIIAPLTSAPSTYNMYVHTYVYTYIVRKYNMYMLLCEVRKS